MGNSLSVIVEEDALLQYNGKFRRSPLLSQQQEAELFKRIDDGTDYLIEGKRKQKIPIRTKDAREAANKVAERNIPLVFRVIQKTLEEMGVSSRYSTDDMFPAGLFGLNKAINSFQYKMGYKFSTYAWRAIKNEVIKEIRKIKKNIPVFSQIPSDDITPIDYIPGTSGENPEEEQEHCRAQVNSLMKCLSDKERTVIMSIYYLEKDLKNSGNFIRLSAERTRQIKHEALSKMRIYAERKNITP
jgi:RNA polymerase primary sigma factor